MPPMRVAVIIPCYNTGHYLGEAIASVLSQTVRAHEVVVVDDGSSDDSAAIATSFPGVRLLRQANLGVSEARNHGLRETTSEAVVFHDADDRLLPHALEIGVRELEKHPDCAFVYGFNRAIGPDGVLLERDEPLRVEDASYARMLEGSGLVPPSSAIFRRSAVEAVGGFRRAQALAEDYELYLRVARRFPIHCHNEVVVEYRRHSANASALSPSSTLRSLLHTLDAERAAVAGRADLQASLERGRRHWAGVFGQGVAFELVEQLRRGQLARALSTLALALRHHPRGLVEVADHYRGRLVGRRRAPDRAQRDHVA